MHSWLPDSFEKPASYKWSADVLFMVAPMSLQSQFCSRSRLVEFSFLAWDRRQTNPSVFHSDEDVYFAVCAWADFRARILNRDCIGRKYAVEPSP